MSLLLNVMLTIGQVAVILIAVFYVIVFGALALALLSTLCSGALAALRYRRDLRCMHAQVDAWLSPRPV